ncbi:glycosyltransferase [Changchengzhania lutea]|uniref:glycosyltransferase n=1 Tax=Changchengzhania lutea TaxID=2049305 RepID=UPI00115DB72E|nr:glycosyltransferase [Changchengzhania lutea]
MKKRILVAPLCWGLGHATRCIPIIHALLDCEFEPVIASDGDALMLLQKEFPNLVSIALPSYNVSYTKKGEHLKYKMFKDSPKLIKAIRTEKKQVKRIIDTHEISGIISDNRLGIHSKKVPSVFITHQLNVLSGNTTWLTTKVHQHIIKKFDACWVPDVAGNPNLSGQLGHVKTHALPTEYIGPISRLEHKKIPAKYAVLILLSGPEPQRTYLEEMLLAVFKGSEKRIIMVKGLVDKSEERQVSGNFTIYNFMTTSLLEKTINESALVISRSGYTTIMDLAKLNKKAFFIPTPGQFEQEYLADRLTKSGLAPSCKQDDFTLDKLNDIENFKGLEALNYEVNYKRLFSLFKGE